jgi:hypothetical protein
LPVNVRQLHASLKRTAGHFGGGRAHHVELSAYMVLSTLGFGPHGKVDFQALVFPQKLTDVQLQTFVKPQSIDEAMCPILAW